LRNAIVARGLYYQMLPSADADIRQQAIRYGNAMGQYEPPFVERLVALTYRLAGQELLWVSRLYTTLFWLVGGAALFALARRMSGAVGALAALAFYLVLPFAVQASRSFQPDPGMVMCLLLAIYALYRWSETRAWKWALLAGTLGGIAILVKFVSVYILAIAALVLVLYTLGWRRAWRNPQAWVMAGLFLLPSLLYYAGRQGRAAQFFESWTISLIKILLQPDFYLRWADMIVGLVGYTALILSLAGILLAASRPRALLIGLWVGYLIYGFFLPYQIHTHNYYSLQLVPIVALSLSPAVQRATDWLSGRQPIWQLLAAGISLLILAYFSYVAAGILRGQDYRGEPAYWQEIVSYLPTNGKIIGITQNYGYRLQYYGWRKVVLWPPRGEFTLPELRGKQKEFDDYFAKKIAGKDYFLITSFDQYADQPELRQALEKGYKILADNDAYLIFDLTHPK
jgi:4-amino-4-deoxy-L-arabinose transferase-like glycosyltransferase